MDPRVIISAIEIIEITRVGQAIIQSADDDLFPVVCRAVVKKVFDFGAVIKCISTDLTYVAAYRNVFNIITV